MGRRGKCILIEDRLPAVEIEARGGNEHVVFIEFGIAALGGGIDLELAFHRARRNGVRGELERDAAPVNGQAAVLRAKHRGALRMGKHRKHGAARKLDGRAPIRNGDLYLVARIALDEFEIPYRRGLFEIDGHFEFLYDNVCACHVRPPFPPWAPPPGRMEGM